MVCYNQHNCCLIVEQSNKEFTELASEKKKKTVFHETIIDFPHEQLNEKEEKNRTE